MAKEKLNGYELSRMWFDFSFENPEKIRPIHSAIYFFAVEHCNRLGWKDKFGFPSQMVMESIGVKNWRTYSKALNDLVDFGFIEMIEISKNQYSSNIIAIVNNTKASTKAPTKALDKALSKHSTKHSQSTVSIDKQRTSNKEQFNKEHPSLKNEDDILHVYDSILEYFPKELHPKSEKVKDSWLDTIEKLNRIDKLSFDDILAIVYFARNHDFWKGQFLSLNKLRKKNRDGVMYYQVFIQQGKNENNKKNGNKNGTQRGASIDFLKDLLRAHDTTK